MITSKKAWYPQSCVRMPHIVLHVEGEGEVAQSCPTLCNPMDCSPPGSSVHGIFQARILEWVAISFSRRSSWPRDWTQVSRIVGRHFTIWAIREVLKEDFKDSSKKRQKIDTGWGGFLAHDSDSCSAHPTPRTSGNRPSPMGTGQPNDLPGQPQALSPSPPESQSWKPVLT